MELDEDMVGLLFFRKGVENPDALLLSEKEAKEAVRYYYEFAKNRVHTSSIPWMSSDCSFAIDLTDIILVRIGTPEEELDDDEENYDLKHGYSPED